MYKKILFLRKNPAMTREEFIDYYETKHSKFLRQGTQVKKYIRRYPVPAEGAPERPGLDFDVMMEIWFDSEEDHDAAYSGGPSPELAEDEKKLFDTDRDGWCTTVVIEVEHETDLSSPSFQSSYEQSGQ